MSGDVSIGSIDETRAGLVARALRWWLNELRTLAPPRKRRRRLSRRMRIDILFGDASPVGDTALIGHADAPLEIRRQEALPPPPEMPTQRAPPRTGPVLILPERLAFRRRIALPREAEPEIDAILRYECSAQLPFAADRLYVAHRIVARQADRIVVEILAAERERLDRLRDRLAAIGLNPAAATIADTEIDLLDTGDDQVARAVDRAIAALVVIVVALGFVALRQPLTAERAAVAALSEELRALRADAAQTERLAAEIAAQEADRRRLIDAFDGRRPRAALLDDLARTVPDGAWATGLSIDGANIRLSGRAASSNKVIARFAASPIFNAPHFPSAIVRDETSGLDRFELQATVAETTE